MPSLAFNVIPPMTEARFEMSDGFTVITAVLPTARLEPLFEEIGFGDDAFAHHYACGTATPQPHLARMIDRLWHASRSTDSVSALLLDGLTLQFLAHVARVKELSPTAAARPEDVRIARAIDFAEAHIDEALTVAELAAVACLSPAHFSRVFKATTGEAVWSFVQRRRGERAMEMLQHTDRSIAEIAFRCGFASQAHFTRCFKRQFGVTPGAVRT